MNAALPSDPHACAPPLFCIFLFKIFQIFMICSKFTLLFATLRSQKFYNFF